MSGYSTESAVTLGTLSSATNLDSVHVGDCRAVLVVVESSSVTSGGTILVQGGLDDAVDATDTDWVTLNDRDGDASSISATADGTKVVVIEFPMPRLRVDCSAYTDGTHVVKLCKVRC